MVPVPLDPLFVTQAHEDQGHKEKEEPNKEQDEVDGAINTRILMKCVICCSVSLVRDDDMNDEITW